jgi:hypothetical protein
MRPRHQLRRLHIWLAWIVGVPLLIWTASGLWMVARPIEEVRGTHLRAPAPVLPPLSALVAPGGRPIGSLLLAPQNGRALWIATFADGGAARADPANGRWLPPVDETEARALARTGLLHPAAIRSVQRSPADRPPLDLRRARPAWTVEFADGVRVHLDADTGAVLAIRTRQWRLFDWMWGVHIMDLKGRENTSHPILIAAAALTLLATVLGLMLLPLAIRRR